MKKLVVALMLLSLSVVSCGKNNSTNSGTAGVSNPITTSIQGASQIGAMIDNYGQYFGSAQASYYMTYLQMVNQGANLKYHYTKTASASSNSNCSLKWGIFYVCSSSSTSSSTSNVTES